MGDRRAEIKALIKAKQAEQTAWQRGILEDMARIDDEELEQRRAANAAMDEEMDRLLDEYKAISAAQGIAPTPRTAIAEPQDIAPTAPAPSAEAEGIAPTPR